MNEIHRRRTFELEEMVNVISIIVREGIEESSKLSGTICRHIWTTDHHIRFLHHDVRGICATSLVTAEFP